jgi:HK97 family phage portal protein
MSYVSNLVARMFGLSTFNGMYSTSIYDRKNPILIDTENKLRIYNTIPHLQSVINQLADMFKNMEIKLYDKKTGEEIKEHEVLNLLNRPNPLRTREEFLFEYYVFKSVFGNAFIYEIKGLPSALPSLMWNLLPSDVEVIPTGKLYNQTTVDGIIKSYKVYDQGTYFNVQPSDMIYKNEGVGGNLITSQSKIDSLQLPLSNIIGALKSENVLIVERGAEGILSNESQADGGAIPLGKEERDRIEREMGRSYGIFDGQKRKIITNSSLKWQPMTFPIKDLMLLECIESDFQTICAAYGADRDIFPSTKGATFENKNNGVKSTYQNTIQPQADDFMSILNAAFGLEKQGLYLVADYSYLPVLQEDEQQKEAAKKTKIEYLAMALNDAVIDVNEYRAELGLEPKMDSGKEEIISDKLLNAQLALRGTVGGVEGLIGLNTAVSLGQLNRESAIAILTNVYGFDVTVANQMITNTPITPTAI